MTPESLRSFVHLADSAWVLPLAAGVWLVLLAQRQWRAAWVWPLAVAGAMSVVVLGKLSFDLFGLALPRWHFYNISGHAMFAALLYPTLGGLLTSGMSTAWRRAGRVAGVGLALALAAVLVWRLDHTLSETIAGAMVGFVASFLVLAQQPRLRAQWRLLIMGLPLAVFLMWQQVYHPVHQARQTVWTQVAHWLEVEHRYTRRISRDPDTGEVVVRVRRTRVS